MEQVTIKNSELEKYRQIMARTKELSSEIRDLENLVDRMCAPIPVFLKKTKTLYRGTIILDLEIMARKGGKIGFQKRRKYSIKDDFASCSISASAAMAFAKQRSNGGVVIEMDVSGISPSDYTPVKYEARPSIYVTPRGRYEYSPYEKFGGTQSVLYILECEVQLKKGVIPTIKSVMVPNRISTRLKRRLERAVEALGNIHGAKISIKYMKDQL